MESDKPKQRPLSAQRTKQYIKIQNLDPRGEFTRRKSLTFAHLYLSSASLSRQPLSANQKLDCESGGHCEKSDVKTDQGNGKSKSSCPWKVDPRLFMDCIMDTGKYMV